MMKVFTCGKTLSLPRIRTIYTCIVVTVPLLIFTITMLEYGRKRILSVDDVMISTAKSERLNALKGVVTKTHIAGTLNSSKGVSERHLSGRLNSSKGVVTETHISGSLNSLNALVTETHLSGRLNSSKGVTETHLAGKMNSSKSVVKETHLSGRDPIVNPHQFRYLLNPKTFCSEKDIFIITFVHSAPRNLMKRQAIRNTWGSRKTVLNRIVLVVFILGQVEDTEVMTSVKTESDRYGDIVQKDFVDSYRNLTYKAIAGLKWVSTFCNQTAYVLKTDDDMFVNMNMLLKHIQSTLEVPHRKTNIILCLKVFVLKVLRSKNSKWYVSKEEYSPDYYEQYCYGMAYLMSSDIIGKLYEASLTTPFFWVDDYYITGRLVHKLNITLKHYDSYNWKMDKSDKRQYAFYNVKGVGTLVSLWNDLKLNGNRSV